MLRVDTGYWVLVISYWVLDTGYWSFTIRQSVVNCPLPTGHSHQHMISVSFK